MTRILIVLVAAYRYALSPMLGRSCRFHPVVLRVRAGGARAPRCAARGLARAQADRALPPVAPRRVRSGALEPARGKGARPRAHPLSQQRRTAPEETSHGYATSHPVHHLLVLAPDAVGGVAEGDSPAGPAPAAAAAAKDADIPAPAAAPPTPGAPAAAPSAAAPAAAAVPGAAAPAAPAGTRELDPRQHRSSACRDRPGRRRHRPRRAAALQRQHRSDEEARAVRPGAPLRRAERPHRRRAADPQDASFTARAREYKLADGQDAVEVKLDATTPDGRAGREDADASARSSYRDRRRAGGHERHRHADRGARVLPAHARRQGARRRHRPCCRPTPARRSTPSKDKFVKVRFDDIDKGKAPYAEERRQRLGRHGAALLRLGAGCRRDRTPREFYTDKIGDDFYRAGVIVPLAEIAGRRDRDGRRCRSTSGRRSRTTCKAIAPGLDLVVDYGWLTVIAAPLFWVLEDDPQRGRQLGLGDHRSSPCSSSSCSSRCRRRATSRWRR